jgi:hypothetical protein
MRATSPFARFFEIFLEATSGGRDVANFEMFSPPEASPKVFARNGENASLTIFTRRAAGLTEEASAAARAAALDADVERAFGEGAILQRRNVGGFPILKELSNLSAEAQAKAAKLLGQEFSPELKAAWKACENPQAVQEMNSATLEAIRRDNFIKGWTTAISR